MPPEWSALLSAALLLAVLVAVMALAGALAARLLLHVTRARAERPDRKAHP